MDAFYSDNMMTSKAEEKKIIVHNILHALEAQGRTLKQDHDKHYEHAIKQLEGTKYQFIIPSKPREAWTGSKRPGVFVTFLTPVNIRKEAHARTLLQNVKKHEEFGVDIHIWILDRTASVEAYIRPFCYLDKRHKVDLINSGYITVYPEAQTEHRLYVFPYYQFLSNVFAHKDVPQNHTIHPSNNSTFRMQKYIPEDKLGQLLALKPGDVHWFMSGSETTGESLRCRVQT